MPATKKTARTQEERNAIAKIKLCQAALELFAIKGYDGTSLSDIGLRAGYSRGLAQYHFPTKEALSETLLDEMGKRELQTHVLNIADDASGTEAWERLERHLDESWKNFRSMHDGTQANLAARGEMILSVTAIFSPDLALRRKLNQVTAQLQTLVSQALRLCIRDGVIRPDLDAEAVALFYTSSIWGMVNALFANPDHHDRVAALVDILKSFMNTLRIDNGAATGEPP